MTETEITHVRQSHSISKSSYMMPASSRKLIFFAMAFAEWDSKGFKSIEVSPSELLNALGMTEGGTTRDLFKSITKETKQQVYTIEDDGYEHISWMAQCAYIKSRDVFKFRLDDSLIQYVRDLKANYSFLPLHGIGQLQGKYSLRLFELVMTNAGFEGLEGNKKGSWWYEDTIEMLRHRFEIKNNEYKRTGDFRTWVIDKPIQEINKSDLGIHVTPEYLRKGKRLIGIRFNVKKIKPSDPRIISPVTQSENEDEALKREYPEMFKKFLKEELNQKHLFDISEETRHLSAEAAALEKVRKAVPKKKNKK